MRSHRSFNPERRSRSGHRPSRTENREHAERRDSKRGKADEPVERRFGILLQAQVAKQLTRLCVPNRLVDHRDDYARSERVELVVLCGPDGPALAEIQYTLRRNVRGKIADFIRAATMRDDEVPRIYLEIENRIGHALKPMAERVAHAIRDITNDLSNLRKRFEQGNVLGMVLILKDSKLTEILPMKLMRKIGSQARAALEELLISRIREREEREAAAAQAAREAEEAIEKNAAVPRRPNVVAPPRMLRRIGDFFRGFIPHPAFATPRASYPLRMPFRR